MVALGVAAAWIAISIVGAKGLVLFARAAASSEFEIDPYPIAAQNGPGREDAHSDEAPACVPGARS
jgi:hypothetical protein